MAPAWNSLLPYRTCHRARRPSLPQVSHQNLHFILHGAPSGGLVLVSKDPDNIHEIVLREYTELVIDETEVSEAIPAEGKGVGLTWEEAKLQLYDLLICIRYSVSPVAFSVPHTFIWHFCAIQYRFLVDGVWRCDETKPFVRDEYGLISNEVLVENNVQPIVQPEPSIGGTNMDKGTILKTMPPEPSSQNPSMQIAVIRHVVSGILLHNTIYDVVPLSSKLTVLDTQLPVKQAFKIMHDEGLALVPLWDDRQGTITGMLTALDFVLISRKLQRNIQVIGNEEPVSAWKEAKLQFYGMMDKAGNLAMKRIIDKRRIHYRREHDGNSKHDWWRQPWDESEVEGLHITMDDFEFEISILSKPGILLNEDKSFESTLMLKIVWFSWQMDSGAFIYLYISFKLTTLVMLKLMKTSDEKRDMLHMHEIDVGSIDEHSTKSDEEYEGLAMRDVMATGPTMSIKL
ncbi:Sucrose nonfermenting 4-like protein [Zea mays]|uniref:Sucrose nonfermenting 4-like protein n=1 Tax=Zea mays TaxID=4577 RepID=A0A3L6FY48_MAIZE|nr:Sucrose nonfermenting 4-like protein [Zea mays]